MKRSKIEEVRSAIPSPEQIGPICSAESPGSPQAISRETKVALSTVLKYLRSMRDLGQAYVHGWYRSGATYITVWALGDSPDAPKPKMTIEEQRCRTREREYERRRSRGAAQREVLAVTSLSVTSTTISLRRQQPATWLSPLTDLTDYRKVM